MHIILILHARSLLETFASAALVVPLYIDTSVSIWGTVREGMKKKPPAANQTDVSSNVLYGLGLGRVRQSRDSGSGVIKRVGCVELGSASAGHFSCLVLA